MKMRHEGYRKREIFRAWQKKYFKYRQKNRIAAYTRNALHRTKLNKIFYGWRAISHEYCKKRLEKE